MKALTPQEKRDVYTYCMLELTKQWDSIQNTNGLCILVDDYIYHIMGLTVVRPMDRFPELKKQKPRKTIAMYWWLTHTESGYNSRMKALEKAIAETYKL